MGDNVMNMEQKKKLIYNLMIGSYDLQALPDSAKTIMENEFAPGSECDKLYSEVYEANRRVCSRLQEEEDKDVELIIANLMKISELLSSKMFDYGRDEEVLKKFDEEEWNK